MTMAETRERAALAWSRRALPVSPAAAGLTPRPAAGAAGNAMAENMSSAPAAVLAAARQIITRSPRQIPRDGGGAGGRGRRARLLLCTSGTASQMSSSVASSEMMPSAPSTSLSARGSMGAYGRLETGIIGATDAGPRRLPCGSWSDTSRSATRRSSTVASRGALAMRAYESRASASTTTTTVGASAVATVGRGRGRNALGLCRATRAAARRRRPLIGPRHRAHF